MGARPASRRRGRTAARSPARSAASDPASRSSTRRIRLAIVGVAVVGVLGVAGYWASGALRPAPAISRPLSPELVDPQVLAHIQKQIDWVAAAPRDPARHGELGMVYFANLLWAEARASFDAAIALDDSNPLPKHYRASAVDRLGEFDLALSMRRSVVREHPLFAPGRQQLGEALVMAGDVDAAAVEFQRVIDLAPEEPYGYVGLGEVCLKKGQPGRAAALLEKALSLKPPIKSAHHLLGAAYRALGRGEDAAREFAIGAEAKKPVMPDAWTPKLGQHARGISDQVSRAYALQDAGRIREGLSLLEEALRWHPDSIELLNNLAVLEIRSRQYERAAEHLHKSRELGPNRFEVYINLSALYLESGQLQEALTHADRAVALGPHVGQAHITRSRILRKLGRSAEALAAMESAVRNDPTHPGHRLELANELIKARRMPDSREHLEAAARLAPNLWNAHVALSEVYLSQGELAAAQKALAEAQRIAPNERDVQLMAARVRKRTEAGP